MNTENASSPASKDLALKARLNTSEPHLLTEEERRLFSPALEQTPTYDGDGNLTSDGLWIYSWNGENRLASMMRNPAIAGIQPEEQITLTFTYDGQGRRIRKRITRDNGAEDLTYTYGDGDTVYNSNQLVSYGPTADLANPTHTYTYDNNGNRISTNHDSRSDTYAWDYDNRLISLDYKTGEDIAKRGLYQYAYDHRTRRVLRDESAITGGKRTELSFSGGLSVQEYDDGSTTPTVEYIRGSDYGGGIGGVLYTIRGGVPTFNSYNSRGDVVSQTDDLGATTWQASYEAFGTRTQEEGDTEERQKANTKDEDPTGLLNEHHRYRDLVTGAFISRDPAGFVDGSNVYTYVNQNPWTFFDPLGLKIDDETHRVREKEVDDPGSWRDYKEEHGYSELSGKEKKNLKKQWKTARDTAKENAKFNEDNKTQIQAWKNYDTAIDLLRSTPEGNELYDTLDGSDNIYTILLGSRGKIGNKTIILEGNEAGKADYLGGNQYVSMVRAGIMSNPAARRKDGTPNVDANAYGHMWEELYHHDQGPVRGRSVYGTDSPKDYNTFFRGKKVGRHPYSHERRATRFQNIIRNRLGGKRVDKIYGQGTKKETLVPDPLGTNIGR